MALKEEHDRLKSDTLAAFHEAKDLQARWAQVSSAQEQVYKVLLFPLLLPATSNSSFLFFVFVSAFLYREPRPCPSFLAYAPR